MNKRFASRETVMKNQNKEQICPICGCLGKCFHRAKDTLIACCIKTPSKTSAGEKEETMQSETKQPACPKCGAQSRCFTADVHGGAYLLLCPNCSELKSQPLGGWFLYVFTKYDEVCPFCDRPRGKHLIFNVSHLEAICREKR